MYNVQNQMKNSFSHEKIEHFKDSYEIRQIKCSQTRRK